MVWPEPQPFRFPHQTTYGTDDMTCKDNPRQPDVVAYRTLRDERDRLEEELAEATRALGAKEMELREARGDAVTANRRRSELGAELHTAQVRIRELEAEAQRLRGANTELHRRLGTLEEYYKTLERRKQRDAFRSFAPGLYRVSGDTKGEGNGSYAVEQIKDGVMIQKPGTYEVYEAGGLLHVRTAKDITPPGSYLIRDPGVYVVTNDENDPLGGLHVVKHPHRDAVVLTAHPDAEPAQWWQLYRDGLTGNLAAWHPPMGLHELIAATAKAYQDPSARPWMGMDPGKPGDDMTTVSWRYPAGDPNVSWFDTVKEAVERINRLEQQMAAKLTEISHPSQRMFERLDRLEAWARQFGATTIDRRVALYGPDGCSMTGYTLVRQDIEPLDSMETKA